MHNKTWIFKILLPVFSFSFLLSPSASSFKACPEYSSFIPEESIETSEVITWDEEPAIDGTGSEVFENIQDAENQEELFRNEKEEEKGRNGDDTKNKERNGNNTENKERKGNDTKNKERNGSDKENTSCSEKPNSSNIENESEELSETEIVPEEIEIGNKMFVQAPEGYRFDKNRCSYSTCQLYSDDYEVNVMVITNSSLQHEVEKELKSKRRRTKRIIKDKEIPVGRHTGRYIETHVARDEFEFCFYIGMLELHDSLLKFEITTKYYDEAAEKEVEKVMENTYYAYWR